MAVIYAIFRPNSISTLHDIQPAIKKPTSFLQSIDGRVFFADFQLFVGPN